MGEWQVEVIHGYGYGYGYGSGDGYGSGYGDIAAASMEPITVSAALIKAQNPCADQYEKFRKSFPNGITIPADIDKAVSLGLDIQWGAKALGIPLPTPW